MIERPIEDLIKDRVRPWVSKTLICTRQPIINMNYFDLLRDTAKFVVVVNVEPITDPAC